MTAPLRSAVVNAAALSVAFENVYCASADNPFRNRPPHLQLTGVLQRIAAGRQVDEAARTRRARIDRAGRIGIRHELLHQAAALGAEIGRRHGERRGKVALHRRLPVVREADAKVGIDGKGIR